MVDYMKRKGIPGVVFKADFRKAYDSVDWDFMLFVLKSMGFGDKWIVWMKACVSTAHISVLLNGSPTRTFQISRGLRQGCPLSPLLFNIIVEVLRALLYKAVELGFFKRFHIESSREVISHLQFADDLIIFCGASETGIKNIVRILRGFELISSLKLNLQKSKLLGINLENEVMDGWAAMLHC
ncbi:hypothetical protein GQ457_04G021940 [Hibiscus cannabinus]